MKQKKISVERMRKNLFLMWLTFGILHLFLLGCVSVKKDSLSVVPVFSPSSYKQSTSNGVNIAIQVPDIIENGRVTPFFADFSPSLREGDEVLVFLGEGKLAYSIELSGSISLSQFSGRVKNRFGKILVIVTRKGSEIGRKAATLSGHKFNELPEGSNKYPECKARGKGNQIKMLCHNDMAPTGYIDNVDIHVPNGKLRVGLTPNASINPYIGLTGEFDGASAKVFPNVATTQFDDGTYVARKTPPANKHIPKEREGTVGLGTCFGVSPNGHLVTNHHVIEGANDIVVRLSDGKTLPARVLTSTASTDLAVLKVDANNTPYLPLVSSRSVEFGDEVFTIGYPLAQMLGTEPKFTDGVISAKSGLGGEPIAYQITVPIQPGNSGGPLVNKHGQVIGVITSTASSIAFFKESGNMPQNINWAVKSDYVFPLLNKIPAERTINGRKMVIGSVKKAACMVLTSR